ncbi:MlaD family protein [Ahrensia kielensis]|uniref:MlaD family protein n=1 Tax=Ahrensia kielensis TaxID=76980 RepID=A0ABU9T6A1_9HYPH
METKANYTLVGLFTVAVFAASFAFVFWIARSGGGEAQTDLDVVIEGSVTGLGVGSPVLFNGINVGKVTNLRFDPTNPRIVIARSRVRDNLPITPSTKAVLGFTGLTGIAHIEFEGGDFNEATVFQAAENEGGVASVTADPSAVNNLLITAQDIFDRTDSVLSELEGFVADARGPLTQTLTNTAKLTDAAAKNTDKVELFMKSMGDLGTTLEAVSGDMSTLLNSANGLVASIPPEDLQAILTNAKGVTENFNKLSGDLTGVGSSVTALVDAYSGTGPKVEQIVSQLQDILGAVKAEDIDRAVSGFADAGTEVQKAAKEVSTLTDGLGEHRKDIETLLANASQMAERLNAASVRVDGVLAKVDGFLGDSSAENVMDNVDQTLASFRAVADTLNARLGTITAGLERFSGRGLRDVEALVSETRRSISRIESAITSLESNPQRLLFGGEGDVKRFDGARQRR